MLQDGGHLTSNSAGMQSLEQSELLQMLAHFFLGVRPEGDAGGDVLWLLKP